MRRRIVFEASAFEDFNASATQDKKLYGKIIKLIQDIDRSPFEGLGKPEPLKYELSGFWSRSLNNEHRLVYQVTDDEIIIASCKYHYE
ncbi:MAG: Txe/YoeB family addiction module toxin [Lyngbya sp.]|nr:Txe/YoeB family addiction module toxin [Lyngbya sp.]